MKQPDFDNGKICYLEIPSEDIKTSSEFYQQCFGWHLRKDNHGNVSFDDSVGQVSGRWVTGRKPSTEPGIVISIMVMDIRASIITVKENGGKVLTQNIDGIEKTAWFTDPFGNGWGLYQHGGE